jgi:hypothetical protein
VNLRVNIHSAGCGWLRKRSTTSYIVQAKILVI